jgi:hypothetical protein
MFLHTKVVDTDQVQPNTHFAVNFNVGMVKWTNCGPATIINNTNWNNGWQTGGAHNVENCAR